MDEKILKAISIAGMFHDLGKFAERAYAVEPADQDMVQQEYRYAHAHHTELALKQLFAEERLSQSYGGDRECTILNMATRHHKPRKGNIYETIIAEADRISSGHERAKGDDASAYDTHGREKKSKTPLISIMSRVCLKRYSDDPVEDWRFRIREEGCLYGTNVQEHIPPVPADEYVAEQVQADYRQHWVNFVKAIRPNQELGLDIVDHFSTLLEICRAWQWCLPASTRKEEMPDVSLFDHQKATAALAACMYFYHATTNTLSLEKVEDRRPQKYLLFCGDLSGIQNFIYQISSKGAYKTLKGRSFYIQLLADLLAREFVDIFGLTPANILYASGGKFYILLPNHENVIKTLEELTGKVNSELFSAFNGDIFVRMGHIPISGEDLTRQSGRTLYQIWDDLTRQLVYQDRQRYADLASENYDLLFGVKSGDAGTCEVCHRSVPRDTGHCVACNQMEEAGRKLANSHYILIADTDTVSGERPTFRLQLKLPNRKINRHIWFMKDLPLSVTGSRTQLWSLNDPNFHSIPRQMNSAIVNSSPYLVAATHAFADRTFDEIADLSMGVKRLGVLRMDVDNLGKIFSEGLTNYRHETEHSQRFHSLGRITTLSWQLNLFFSGLLPGIIRNDPDLAERVTVVYAGGDDLFLLGAWDALPELALTIHDRFEQFCCNNRSLSLSGGMVITGGKFPIYKSAEMAGEAEHRAKHHETRLNGHAPVRKSSFTFLDTPMHWKEFKDIVNQFNNLMSLLEDPANAPLLRRLLDIAASWQGSRERLKQSGMTMAAIEKQLEAEKWRWQMVYSLARFVERNKGIKDEIASIQQFILCKVAETDRTGITLLGLLGRWCELRLRTEKKEKKNA
ncbi:MAG: type III-A CRISPR-associated protein Cas10/Csm1 [Deltaproteobacteria bacterium RIFOXYD12_FULL_56_24]|nr:MAG: type III-A CRISPR-associated protein Cas10/Csm1 [Deltaproteobacteria bacterium RIFOXYD12_FULL_56_24]